VLTPIHVKFISVSCNLASLWLILRILFISIILFPHNVNSKMITKTDGTIELIHGAGEATHAIIWLHGLGATANDFPPIVPQLGLDEARTIRFIFPQAPQRPITINGGMRMPGWYDIKGVSIADKQDATGMAESQATLNAFVESQIDAGIPAHNIIVAGFSQGGAVAYFTAVRSELKLAGVLALSTYLPFAEDTETEQTKVNQTTPFFASHGTHDPVVPISLGKASVDSLQGLGYQVRWKTYPMDHTVVLEQIEDVGRWINSVFSGVD